MDGLRMERKAADNLYQHRDFNITLDLGLSYLAERYGVDAVAEYLERFTLAYYGSLIEEIKQRGLAPLAEMIRKSYESEGASEVVDIELEQDSLQVVVSACPVEAYFKKVGHRASPWYFQTTDVVNGVIAKQAGIRYRLTSYNKENGASEYCFWEES